MKFKLNTKVNSGQREGDTVKLEIEAAKGGKTETLDADVCLVAIGRRPYTAGLGLENIGMRITYVQNIAQSDTPIRSRTR
jgi:dihydrolipoamide dehydrogenase